jgi:mono/diheme cytochrome c family protein
MNRIVYAVVLLTFAATAWSAQKQASDQSQAQAKEVFSQRCVMCHGDQGKGDGPGGAVLDPKPRNFHDEKWQKSVTDAQIKKAILNGGAAVGKSPLMIANPDIQPAVADALVKMIRQFGQQK